ncbi:threonine/serine exporter family protein [Cellulosimicrobium terreum]|nr:threonine/serine exporter family protein [Cellulosimicrobium terreum]
MNRRWLDGLRHAPSTFRRVLHALGPEGGPDADEPPDIPPDLVPLLRELGRDLLDSGLSVGEVEETLAGVAQHAGASTVGTLVLPTGVFVRVSTQAGTISDFTGAAGRGLNLDQIGALYTLVGRILRGELTLAESRSELAANRARPARFGPVVGILGHGILTVGFGLVLNPTAHLVPVYLALGMLVGALRWLGSRWPTLQTALPVVAAFVVTVLAIQVVHPWLGDDPLRVLVPPLVSFLPGSVLTIGAIELTGNQIVAGASRVVYGLAQLLLLVFGVVAGAAVSGSLVSVPLAVPSIWWAPWVGILAIGIGQMLFAQTPRGSLAWVILVLLGAYGAQLVGALAAGELAGFFGALVVPPLAALVQRTRNGPPSIVTTLPAFWLLVPGALSLVGLSDLVSGGPQAAQEIANAVVAVFGIALGVLVGSALTRDAGRVTRTLFTT